MTSQEAMEIALDWAESRRSNGNLGHHHGWEPPYTPDVIAAMDAQEVLKWSAVAVALDAIESRKRDSP